MEKKLKDLFLNSKNLSNKWEKYFNVYEECFASFKDKKITFVEIGVHNGGSLSVWKNFFGENSRIIGIDINPECKKFEEDGFEIFIGNQSDPKFWETFFNKVGNVDIILDDGGHTNLDQITTVASTVENINDGGLLVIEDVHTSYIEIYNSRKKFSFVSFAKKIVDDINYTFDNTNKFNFSLNTYIYSTQFYESIVVFKIDRDKCLQNKKVDNSGLNHNIEDQTWAGNEMNIAKFKKLTKKIKFIKLKTLTNYFKNRVNNKKLTKFFD